MPSGSLSSLPRAFTSLSSPECADPKLAISAIWTFRDLGVRGATVTIFCPRSHPDRVAQGHPATSPSPHRAGVMVSH